MIILDCNQRDEAWYAARLGIPTASGFSKLFTASGKPSSSAETYMYELIGERLTGLQANNYINEWMQRGIDLEDEARDTYQFIRDYEAEKVGFVYLDEKKNVGCSPDGLIGKDGMLEIKCPKTSTHVRYLLKGTIPTEYIPQIQGQLWITGRQWCDFMSYDPDCDPLIIRIERDEDWIYKLSATVMTLNQGIEKAMQQLRRAA
jgi:putative phage-type endonuclease